MGGLANMLACHLDLEDATHRAAVRGFWQAPTIARREGLKAVQMLEAVAEREAGARRELEMIARANFAAQTQTHVAALDLMEAQTHADLSRQLDAVAQARFGLAGADTPQMQALQAMRLAALRRALQGN